MEVQDMIPGEMYNTAFLDITKFKCVKFKVRSDISISVEVQFSNDRNNIIKRNSYSSFKFYGDDVYKTDSKLLPTYGKYIRLCILKSKSDTACTKLDIFIEGTKCCNSLMTTLKGNSVLQNEYPGIMC